MEDLCLGKHKSWWLFIFMMSSHFMVPQLQAVCVEEERKALLEIKASLNDSFSYGVLDPLLPTWVDNGECCQWERVKCDTTTCHITDLSLKSVIPVGYCDSNIAWQLNVSLFLRFKELTSLNLSYNCIHDTVVKGINILSSLKKLERLDLSSNMITNDVVPSLMTLTSLKVLNLGDNHLEGKFPSHEFAALENLEELYLRDSDYYSTFHIEGSERGLVLKKLRILDLGYNAFNESLMSSLSFFPSLKALNLEMNALRGSFPAQELSEMISLEKLDLTAVGFNGTPGIQDCMSLMRLKKLVSLSLGSNSFNKSIISCLSFLPSLNNLDLYSNQGLGSSFPSQELSSLRALNTLVMSNCGLQSLPTLNGTMSNLLQLSLDNNNFTNHGVIKSMAAFPSLRYLSLQGSFFEGGILSANDFPNLHDLRVLKLGINKFNGALPVEAFAYFQRLEVLDLSYNNFVGSIPSTIKLSTFLKAISFSNNKLNGSLPDRGFCELRNLRELDLSNNMFDGNLPECFSMLSSLKYFDISSNQFTGILFPSLITNLRSLKYIDISHNKFEGLFSFSLFSNHTNLEIVEFISDNDKFEVETEEPIGWIPMFQLKVLMLTNCNVNRPKARVFPNFLSTQKTLLVLDMSHNSMEGQFPDWLIKNNTILDVLNLRNNSFSGNFSMPFYDIPIRSLDLSGNRLIGDIPRDIQKFLPYATHLNLSKNYLEGTIPSSIGDLNQLKTLDLSHNQLSGKVPIGIFTNMSELFVIDLSNNTLHGEVLSGNLSLGNIERLHLDSNCFKGKIANVTSKGSMLSKLTHLDIGNNLFTGSIPPWIGNSMLSQLVVRNNRFTGHFPCGKASFQFLDISQNYFSGPIPSCLNFQSLEHLHLGSNIFTGSIPNSFHKLSSLLTLDIGKNSLSGRIPEFLSDLSNLRILQLRKNKFSGSIPKQLCQLRSLSFIDLSSNSLSGSIPRCLNNITGPTYQAFKKFSDFGFSKYGMTSSESCWDVLYKPFEINDYEDMFGAQDEVAFTTKSLSLTYKGEVLDIMSGLDLSCNKLTGDIPEELGLLTQIHALNLSHNMLTGPIPLSLSNLTNIESLDLSSNVLGGKVPAELIKLNSLSVFNVSYNTLSGKLPEMTAQFGTFTKESYEGNPLLCGHPLENKCVTSEPPVIRPSDEEETHKTLFDIDMVSFYGSTASTWFVFVVGVLAVLYINPYWRRKWLDAVEECMYTCYYFLHDLVKAPHMLLVN